MKLHEYPRPANDTGIGMHWVAGYASAIGMGKIRDYWIPELKALGVRWLKIFNHDGAIDFAELLLAEGIMPIVRLYQPTPNPTRLGVKEIVHLEAFIRAGVHYFEFNHEPDQDGSWRNGRVPADGLDLVTENTIANMETILERGGMPSVPAVSNGSRWDIIGQIVRNGRKDLFEGPVWQAAHNYSLNRPLDYPYDIGNQEGAAYTQRFFQAIANEEWGENAWRGRTLVEVNRLRIGRSSPGATVADDSACWLAYEHLDKLNRRHLGHSIPILSTESGYIVGEDHDPRYPATTPDLHMAQTLEACRVMMGTSKRFKPAPDYYFCTAFWLMANARLGSSSNWWEGHAWYSERWTGGMAPIVHALRAEPKAVRRWRDAGEVGATIKLHGIVLHAGEMRTVVVEQDGREVKRIELDSASRYLIDGLLPGKYTVRVARSEDEQSPVDAAASAQMTAQLIELTPGKDEVVVNFDLTLPDEGATNSVIFGSVRGGAGSIVMLLRASDGEEWVTLARDDGSFRFVDLPAGVYNARVHANGGRVNDLVLDGANELAIELAVNGWGHTVEMMDRDQTRTTGSIRCEVQGLDGIRVRAFRGEWESKAVFSGSAPDLGSHMCVIEPLEPGRYLVVADDLPGANGTAVRRDVTVRVEKKRIPLAYFVFTETPEEATTQASAIHGRVIGAFRSSSHLRAALIDENAQRVEATLDQNGVFEFSDLSAGLYTVEIVGHEDVASRADIALDGANSVEIELPLPARRTPTEAPIRAGRSVIAAYAPDAGGRLARLTDNADNEYTRMVGDDDQLRIGALPAGTYTLTVEGGYVQEGLEMDGLNGLEVLFSPVVTIWESETSEAGSMPGFSVLRVEVEGKHDWPVRIWQEDGEEMVRRTGDKSAHRSDYASVQGGETERSLGEYAVEFRPLEPGRYMVQPDEVDEPVAVDLTGLEAMWVNFRQRVQPISPHLVRPLLDGSGQAWTGASPSGSTSPAYEFESAYYLFIGKGLLRTEHLSELLDNIIQNQVPYGADVARAKASERVLIVGKISDELFTRLSENGANVMQLDKT